jgi:hypothetical protein
MCARYAVELVIGAVTFEGMTGTKATAVNH